MSLLISSRLALTTPTKALMARTLRSVARALKTTPQASWRVLMYHAMTPKPLRDPWGRAVSLAQFEQQLAYLAQHHYRVLPLQELVDGLRAGRRLPSQAVSITFDDGYAGTSLAAKPLAGYGWTATTFVTTDWVGRNGHPASPLETFLSWTDLKGLRTAGWDIGSHGCSHRRLNRLSEEAAWHEMAESKRTLEAALQQEVRHFSFPHGLVPSASGAWLAEFGYRGACTSRPGINGPGTDPYELRRLEITGRETLETFGLKLEGYYDWLGVIRPC